jgi:thioredoxin-dependent peroxiredoxin
MPRLAAGQPAPDFELQDQQGNCVKLTDFRGRKLLLYFYPKADTPGCTRQACSIRDARPDLAGLGLAVLGVSRDEPARQQKFDRKYALDFPLLSDPDHAVAAAYGVWGEKTMYGKKVQGITRSAFLIDEQGQIIQAWYGVKPEDTVPQALKALQD